MWREIFSGVIDLVVPPRDTDLLVRSITREDLDTLALQSLGDGGLPYRDERVRALVWELKYFANPTAAGLAGAILAEELLSIAQEELGKPLLIPVPMHKARRRERGHNQTELLCDCALRSLGEEGSSIFEYRPDILTRVTHTETQQGLERSKRLNNVQGAMRAEGPDVGRIAGRVCVVVDDVTTTGATFAEAKRALREAKARRIICVALARS